MDTNSPQLPTQAKTFLEGRGKVNTYESTGGLVTAQFAAHNLSLIPPIAAGSIVHDNMAGAGTVTRAILTSNSNPSDIKLYATDTDQLFLDALQDDVTKNSWPVEVSNQRAEELKFPDEHFTHSITNIGIFFTTSFGLDGAKEIYRTLKPGGTAVVNCWEHVTWFLPMKFVHDATRPGQPYPAPPIGWSDGKQLQKVLREAGFKEENWKVERSDGWAKVSKEELREWAAKTWSYLGGIGRWQEGDEEKWDEAVSVLVESLKKANGTKVLENGGVEMRASQWVVIATK